MEQARDADLTGDRRRFDAEGLIAGKCRVCAATAWPRRSICHRCGSDEVAEYRLPAEGSLLTWTTAWVPVADIEPPYTLGMVHLDGVEIFMHVRNVLAPLKAPHRVQVVVDAAKEPPFWAEPA